jgi:hypothetical protein
MIMFETGNMRPRKIEVNKFSPVKIARGYHRQPGKVDPKIQVRTYMVKGKPYISVNRATINAK